jgi:hypothetical protein
MGVQEEPVELPEPVFTKPAAFPGCQRCEALDRAWIRAVTPGTAEHNPSQGSDYVVEIRRHHKQEHRRQG